MIDLEPIAKGLISGKPQEVSAGIEEALRQGAPPGEILQRGLLAGMESVGEAFKNDDIFLPEVLLAAKAMKAGMELLNPLLSSSDLKDTGLVILGTVRGDMHDIGKSLVGTMLEGVGFAVMDLGVDVSPERFVEAVRDQKAQILGMSALITTTMVEMRNTIEALESDGLRQQVQVMIGGAPGTRAYADRIEADSYALNATFAVEEARRMLRKS